MKSRLEQLEIEIAFEKGARIEYLQKDNEGVWFDKDPEMKFHWNESDYRIKEEPRRIPFDGSDAFGLMKCIFKEDEYDNIFFSPLEAGEIGIRFHNSFVKYEDLSIDWLKWNDLTKEWQPCNKVA